MADTLRTPKGFFQETVRRLAEVSMSVTHHDISHNEPEAIHEIQVMERRFTNILRGKLISRPTLAAKEQQADTGIMMSPTEMILTQDENSLIGLVMRLTGGRANPNVIKGQIERIRKEKACETTSSPS